MKTNTFVLESSVETIMGEIESIISEVENVYDSVTDDDMLDVIQFNDIRDSAEELETFVLQMVENEYISNTMLEQCEDISITLYQNIKYILEHCEIEIFSSKDTDILESFNYMRTSVNTIRNEIDTLVLQMKC